MGFIKTALKWILIAFVVIVFLGIIFGGSDDQATTSKDTVVVQPTETKPAEATQTKPVEKVYAIGDRVEVGELAYTITGMRTAPMVGSNDFGARADGIFMIVDMKIENIGEESKTIDSSMMKAIDSQSRTFDSDNEAWAYLENNLFLKQVQPGLPATGQIVFDVPQGEAFSVEVSGGMWSGDKQLIAVGNT
ncbi:MAG: DUF4352 domain-containing protein [Methanomethylovorans sp.]|uniref:DUF4352 domain-containing protein n=1 Tax=Methanomethylovorans sp. TaxID=2758717 RepID=UPI003C72ECC2